MRIVSLVPSVTETLIDFGLATNLVGITRFCIHPADVVKALPKIGGTKDPKIDRIVAAAPDLVFLNEEENRREDYETLRRAGLRVETAFPRRVDQVPDDLRRIGEACGTVESAQTRAHELETALADLERRQKAQPNHFTFAYLIWRNPWMTINGDTYVSDLLGRAGGRNVFHDRPTRYPELTLNELAERRPDVVLLPDEPFPFKEAHRQELEAELPEMGHQLISGDDACWHGIRSIRGVALAHQLGDQWGQIDRPATS